jgi:5'-3' exonuclease
MRRPPKTGTKVRETHTLVIDGNALFKRGYHGAKDEYNREGNHIGGIYQFITVIRKLLTENVYNKVFVFWDGEFSGRLRYELYPDYKIKRGKDFINGTKPEDKDQIIETYIVQGFLDDLYIRQVRNTEGIVEGDDFIAYYCLTKEEHDKVTIVTHDTDLCQLINEDVQIYLIDKKSYVTHYNFNQYFDYHKDNAVLVKTICGDSSDSIRGVKGIGLKTLLTHFPELGKTKVYLHQIIDSAKEIQAARLAEKKKPIKALDNLINGVTTDIEGKKEIVMGMALYERNQVLVDLSLPMMTEDSILRFEEAKNSILAGEDRGIKEAYKKMKEFGIDVKVGSIGIEYLTPFKKLIDREKNLIVE